MILKYRWQLKEIQLDVFSYEDVGAFLRFLSEEVKISEQVHISSIIEQLFTVVDPVNVGTAKRASELSTEVGTRLLSLHMTDPEGKSLAPQIAANLNKSFFAHGDAVSRTRARELQLKIANDDPVLESLMWKSYLAIEQYMRLREPFKPMEHFLKDPNAVASINVKQPLNLPPNTPNQLAQQIWQQAANQALQRAQQSAVEVDYSVVNAVVESARLATEFRTTGKISAYRSSPGELQLTAVDHSSGWKNINIPSDSLLDLHDIDEEE